MARDEAALARARAVYQSGDPAAAARLYGEHLRAHPDDAGVWCLLGGAQRAADRPEEAAASYREALRLRPAFPEAWNNLGNILMEQKKPAEAVDSYRQALRLRPDFVAAHTNLGNVLTRLGRPDEAVAHYREAVRLRPTSPDAHIGLGNTLAAQRKFSEAEACYREALRLRPDYPEGRQNLGTALAEQGLLEEAVICYREALRLKPDYVEAGNNLATTLLALSRPAEALAAYDLILRHQPEAPEVHLSRAQALLLMGDWERAWREYEWRWKREEFGGRPYPQPRWDGSPLDGRTVLLHGEQGLGDTLLVLRYAPLVKARGGRVVLGCPKALTRLLAGCPGVDQLVPEGSPLPPFDCYVPLMSLPGLFGTTPADVPADAPYLIADPGLVERWQRELAPWRGLTVGIAWQGNPRFQADRLRSIPLAQFAPLAAVPGIRLVSLQKGHGAEQLRGVGFPVVDLGDRLDETSGPFMDTAAVMKNLDLVITSDTAIPHLAGALGVPVWLALCFSPHGTWLLGREDSPWYPSMRLFRQPRPGDWADVFERMAGELRRLAAAPLRARPVVVEIAPGEMLDKIAILRIKNERMADPGKAANVRRELAVLEAAAERVLPWSDELARLAEELRAVNGLLWQVENDLRACEADGDFGSRFVDLARSVYRHNDRRAALKRAINDLLGSSLKEEKAYSGGTQRARRAAELHR